MSGAVAGHRHAVGRRGQGQDRRPAHRPRLRGGAVPGRAQRRPHPRHRGDAHRAASRSVRGDAQRGAVSRRARRRAVADRARRRDAHAGRARRAGGGAGAGERRVPAHPPLPRGARPGPRGGAGSGRDRHHRTRVSDPPTKTRPRAGRFGRGISWNPRGWMRSSGRSTSTTTSSSPDGSARSRSTSRRSAMRSMLPSSGSGRS